MRYLLAVLALSAHLLFADPQGFQLIAGDANAPVDNGAGITIQSGRQAIIQWDSFSIDAQRMVRFDQLDGNSAVLNRVMGGAESQLMGSLLSNGKVYLINPNGVLIGPNGRIETAGFIASTADVLNDDFLKGQELLFGDVGPGKIIHLGVIECPTGDVTLLARVIDAPGNIHAGGGTVLLLQPKGQSDIFIDTGEECALHQSGRIEALKIELRTSPNPYLKAIRCDGVLEAIEGVEIYAEGGLAELNGAQIHCDSGTVHLLGESVFLNEEVKVDVSGDTQGGTILIGGDYLGQNEDIPNADYLFTGSKTILDARCRQNGNGGKIILWGVKGNHAHGAIHAMGGPQGGDGGFVEISSLGDLRPTGHVSTLAPMGKTGTLLFDPCDVTISGGAPAGYATSLSVGTSPVDYYYFSGSTATIDIATLANGATGHLDLNNVTINADASGTTGSGSILITAGFTWSVAHTLTLIATGSTGNGAIRIVTSGGTISNTMGPTTNFDALVCSVPGGSAGGFFFGTGVFQTSYGNMSFITTGPGFGLNLTGNLSFHSSGTGAQAGNFTFSGTSTGSGTGFNITNASTTPCSITTVDGNITITGTSATGNGVLLETLNPSAGSTITISSAPTIAGTGKITINGTTNSAASNGVILETVTTPTNSLSIATAPTLSGVGNITITGVNTAAGSGVNLITSASVGEAAVSISTKNGNIIIDGSTTGGSQGTNIAGNIQISTTTGNMTFQSANGTRTFVTIAGPNIPSFTSTTGGIIAFSAPLTLATTPTISSTPAPGAVVFSSTVDGAIPLTVTGTNSVSFNGIVGGTTPLTSLATPSTALLNIGASFKTVNDPNFTIPVAITGASTITSTTSSITFGSTLAVNSPLTLTPTTTNAFNGVVTLASNLHSTSAPITFSAGVIVSGTSIITADVGAITFNSTLGINGALTLTPATSSALNGAVTVNGASSITSTQPITFNSTIDGGNSLTITPSAGVTFVGAIGSGVPLSSLTVSGTTNQTSALNARTTGNMTFSGAISAAGQDVILTLTTAGAIKTTGVTAANITMQPTNTSSGGIPDGTIILAGGLTATGAITLGASPARAAAVRVATITSTLAGNDVTITGNSFLVGPFEAMTVFGNLSITATNGITIGDAVASNMLTIHGGSITLLASGVETLLDAGGTTYLSNSNGLRHFISNAAPSIIPAQSAATVNTVTANVNNGSAPLFQALLTRSPSTMLNIDSSIGIQLPSCSTPCNSCCPACPSCPTCNCSTASQQHVHLFGFIVNQELVANSQLLELLPILWPPTYWPYHGLICNDIEDCESPYFETFSWNNDVR